MVLGFLFKKKRSKLTRAELGFLKPYDKDKLANDWSRVEELIATKRPSAYKEAIILADKLLDYALTQISPGETMGERLKNASSAFSRDIYQGLWDAHKMRNALVHETDFDITVLVSNEMLGKFKRGFEYLGVRI